MELLCRRDFERYQGKHEDENVIWILSRWDLLGCEFYLPEDSRNGRNLGQRVEEHEYEWRL